jgi:hypothetical protein
MTSPPSLDFHRPAFDISILSAALIRISECCGYIIFRHRKFKVRTEERTLLIFLLTN